MRKAIPEISEDVATLKHLLQREPDGRKKVRLQMRYLLASGQATTRQAVGNVLGVHRNTIGHWLARYETGGLLALLDRSVPAGKPLSLAADVVAALDRALHQPSGFASYEALRQWLKQTHHLDVNYHTL